MRRVARAVAFVAVAAGLAGPARSQPQAPASVPTAQPSAIPAEAFYRRPDIQSALLSPSGRWLALRTSTGGARVSLGIFDLQEWKPASLAARLDNADVADAAWIDDDRLVFTTADQSLGVGERKFLPGLFVVPRTGGTPKTLIKADAFINRNDTSKLLGANHALLLATQDQGGHIVVGQYEGSGDDGLSGEFTHLRPKRLNVDTLRVTELGDKAPKFVKRWLFDGQGRPRVAVTGSQGRSAVYWYPEAAEAGAAWQLLAEYNSNEPPFTPQFVGPGDQLWVSAADRSTGTSVLKRFDFAKGKPADEAAVATPGFDFTGHVVTESPGSKPLGVRVLTDGWGTVWFEPRLAALQKEVDAKFPNRSNRINCRRCEHDDIVALVVTESDRDPGQYWIYQGTSKQWRALGQVRRAIDPRQMGRTTIDRVRMRDGLEIPVWVTHPATGSKPAPAVVLVHGGPWVRGRHWGWNADAQFLASRGYAVIEPEFRGSAGFGQALFKAGWREWGRAMQDDVADALKWAVAQGGVDASRVCIAGASYGGYAALMGVIRNPELYRCAAAWSAVTDPLALFNVWGDHNDLHSEGRRYTMPLLIGDPNADAERLKAVSPVHLADQLRAPLLLAYGSADKRVAPSHGERLREALAAAGQKPPQWVVYPGEGHGWQKLETRIDFAQRLESFLAEHLK